MFGFDSFNLKKEFERVSNEPNVEQLVVERRATHEQLGSVTALFK